MKIGFVRRGYSSTGGAEAYLLRLARGVRAAGHEPLLITSREWPEGNWPNDLVVRVDAASPDRFAREVGRAASGCDVLFSMERILSCDVYRAGDGVHRAWLERRAAFEPAWRSLARKLNPKHRELLRLERHMFSTSRTRRVIANSTMVRDEIVTHYGYPAEQIEVIPNGYDSPPMEGGLRMRRRAEWGVAADDFIVLFAGSGWKRKGLGTAIAAARDLPSVRLFVAGRGNARAFHGEPHVRFLGPRADLRGDFAAADAFLLPTIYDPFSNACLEALAAGLPVLTTTANGFSEIIDDGVHGSKFAPGDVEAARRAIRDWKSRDRAAAARAVCEERARLYSEAENTRRTLDVIMRSRPR